MPSKSMTIRRSEAAPTPEPKSFYIPAEELPGFQDLFGGIPRASVLASLGAPGSCKSTLFAHLCVEVAKAEKGNILVFDTENKFAVFMHLAACLSERYDMRINVVRVRGNIKRSGGKDPKYEVEWQMEDEVDADATNLFVVHCPKIPDIMTMFGNGVDLKIYESGKYKVITRPGAYKEEVEDYPVSVFFTKHNCKVLLIDSITNPLDKIPAVGENLPARTDLTQMWFLQIHDLAYTFDMPVLATFHESLNETGAFSKDLKIEGGKGVTYNLAYILYMLKENKLGLLPKGATKPKRLSRAQRAMYLVRHASTDKVPWKDVKYFRIDNQGLHDDKPGGQDMDDDEDEGEGEQQA